MNPRVELICVGTELLTGKVNTHTAFLGAKLAEAGLSISREHAVGDDRALMRETFAEAFRRSRVIISAGGLGPTFDDITRDVWSQVIKRPLELHPTIVDEIRQKFRDRGLAMPPKNRRQAMVLKGADVIPNAFGTAPGQIIHLNEKILVLLPGPSRELYPMVEHVVMPRLKEAFPGNFSVQKILLIFGIAESRVDEIIRPWVARHKRFAGCRVTHGILASQSIISVKFTVQGRRPPLVRDAIKRLVPELRTLLGDMVFGEDGDTLEGVTGKRLRSKRKTAAVAESCTGGLIAKLLTDPAGASDYFSEGFITYSNTSKIRRLGVRADTLRRHGAVSEETAREMASGLRKAVGVDYALSVTGIAGPTGGNAEKPIGLVYVGVAGPRRVLVRKFKFSGDRSQIRHRAALNAIDLLRRELS